ncbi:hypothetical protein HanPSC8_Chr10g0416941 [Helianthus annuus]|nr:hypothetical protein HanPSC8_Chr10g0416941 [Helianthus annuus]
MTPMSWRLKSFVMRKPFASLWRMMKPSSYMEKDETRLCESSAA